MLKRAYTFVDRFCSVEDIYHNKHGLVPLQSPNMVMLCYDGDEPVQFHFPSGFVFEGWVEVVEGEDREETCSVNHGTAILCLNHRGKIRIRTDRGWRDLPIPRAIDIAGVEMRINSPEHWKGTVSLAHAPFRWDGPQGPDIRVPPKAEAWQVHPDGSIVLAVEISPPA